MTQEDKTKQTNEVSLRPSLLHEDKIRFLNMTFEEKVQRSKELILEWFLQYKGNVYVAFSGGKDSTVLLHLVRSVKGCENVVGVFSDTGLEYPEIRDFVKQQENIMWIKPKLTFKQVIEKYGYPVISKEQASYIYEARTTKSEKLKAMRTKGGSFSISNKWLHLLDAPFKVSAKCCDKMKKEPFKKFEKETGLKPILGIMASESKLRLKNYMSGNCNAFSSKRPTSKPLSFWNEDDIWEYIRRFNLQIAPVYKCGYKRTGCMFCMFGADKDDRFKLMKQTHPKLYEYIMTKLNGHDVLKYTYGDEVNGV